MLKRFVFYKQFDQMDCGPTCLRMIAKYYGKNYPLQFFRNQAFLTREGVSLLGISDAAEAIGFHTFGVKISFNKLALEGTMPCIVHWNQNHFVVVCQITKRKVRVADPAVGLIDYSHAEFAKSWAASLENGEQQGIALLLEPAAEFYDLAEPHGIQQKRKSIAQLLHYLKGYKKSIVQLLIGLAVGSLIQLILPFLAQAIVDVGINTRNINFIYLVLCGQLALFISRTAVDFIRRWILLHVSTRINISIISDFLIKLMKLPVSFFDGKMVGDVLQRVDDHARVERLLSSSSLNMLFSIFNVLVFGAVLAFYEWRVFATFALFSITHIAYTLFFLKRRASLDHKRFGEMSQQQNNLIQLIHGMPEIKLNNAETPKRWEWERIQARIFRLTVDSTRLQQYQDAGSLFINEFKNILITVMTAVSVIDGHMTLGMMLAVQYIIGQLNAPVNEFITFTKELQDARLSLDRIGEIHNLENEENHLTEWQEDNILPASGSIILDNVSFQYDGPNSPNVLDQLDLIIPEGKVTAIVGTSGSGKTTLLKLLLKFYTPTEGTVKVGGVPLAAASQAIRALPASLWRKQCGVVMQEGYIFSDTIARNIVLTGEQIDRKKLLHAVRVANIGTFIESLPLGYHTKIGANGIGLSQGQKQRLLIARAVYKNPSFMFFDEATSALDANNEKAIMENLDTFLQGKTVVVIAHRLSTVKNADQIVVLHQGRIVEVGTHQSLTHAKGNYYELVRNQLELGS